MDETRILNNTAADISDIAERKKARFKTVRLPGKEFRIRVCRKADNPESAFVQGYYLKGALAYRTC